MTPPSDKKQAPKWDTLPGVHELIADGSDLTRDRFLELSRGYLALLKKNLIDLRTRGTNGRAFVRSYSDMVDVLVGLLFQRALEEQARAGHKIEIAVIGMGGYGRRELAPYSDVDILVLCKRKTPTVKKVAAAFVQLMWDVGFELGHSVQSLVENESAFMRHMDARTALFESRWICGSRAIAAEVMNQIKRMRRKDREGFLARKVKDATDRHEKNSNSYQLIEPSVKVSPGGLRDYQTLVWLGMVLGEESSFGALRRRGLLLSGEESALREAYDFLLRVRVELHVQTESKQDQLTVRYQKLIARELGYKDRGDHLAVELFMRDYYNHTRTIFRVTADIIGELDGGRNLAPLLREGKVAQRAVRISRTALAKDPLRLFKRQQRTGRKLDRRTRRRLAEILKSDLKGRAIVNCMRHDFPSLFTTGENLTLVLRTMHDTGFLGAIIPEYNTLTSLKRYDVYHHYTADEHSFQVVQNLERLHGAARHAGPQQRLYSEIPDKQVLYLAALLHDIGKIEGRGHAKKGAVLARKILKRMRVSADKIDQISYLIEIHLLMSHFAQRRDPTDVGTLRAFCAAVRNRTTLKNLCLLTDADLRATSPLVWTEWKWSLLWTLYLGAYEFMARTEKQPDSYYKASKKELLRHFKGAEKARAREHLDMLPGRYLLTMNATAVKKHIEAVEQLSSRTAVVQERKGKTWTEFTFCTMDRPFRLSQMCGVLTANDCNILMALAFTRTDGKVIDVFRVQDLASGGAVEGRTAQIAADLGATISDDLAIQSEVDRHVRKWKRLHQGNIPVPLKVEFENDLSVDVTIIDIFATDRPGLLYKLTRALSEEGLTILRARISTEGHRVIDSFDVQDGSGSKVTSAAELRRIRQRLEAALD